MRLIRAAVLLACLLVAALAAAAPARAAKPVSVTITHVSCVSDCDEDGLESTLESTADFYAKVFVNGVEQPRTPRKDDDPNHDPHWTVLAQVPDDLASVPVGIQVWDYDSSSGDDLGDASPNGGGDNNLDLVVDYASGQWTSPDGASFPQSCSTGGGGDEPRVKVCFTIATRGDGDFDDDGIPDAVERFGLRGADGNLAPISGVTMDPCRKTIALQIDWMADGAHSHAPLPAAITDAVAAMNAAPVPAAADCPYAGFPQQAAGVNLVVELGRQIPEQERFDMAASLPAIRDGGGLPAERRPYMHYVIFAHNQADGGSSSGLCCIDNRDFIVTLGSWANNVGTFRDQSGTILHELGHALNLGHGGADETNYKPNYLSVMNYSFDPGGIPDPTIAANIDTDGDGTPDQSRRLDYSRAALPALNEAALDENLGIQDGTDQTIWWDPGYVVRTGAGTGGIDWNQSGGALQAGVRVDLNRDHCIDAGADGTLNTTPAGDDAVVNGVILAGPDFVCNTAAAGDDTQNSGRGSNVLSTLTGYDDWANINYRAAMSVTAAGADSSHDSPDITAEAAQAIQDATAARYAPDLTLAKSVDKAEAAAGDTLTYSLATENVGTGDATAVEVRDTLPDGSVATRSPGTVAAGATDTQTVTYAVPCATTDGTQLVNRATVSGTNLLNNPEVDTSDNAGSATTTVRAPKVTLAKTAPPTANPGEAIAYRLTYANAGSGEARSIVVTDVLPADVYYSPALDLGTVGPRPSTVVRNPDGTTTLTWTLGSLAGGAGAQAIEYTARPSLLFLGGSVGNAASLTFTNASGCTYAPVAASATTALTAVAPTRNPLGHGYWKNHPAEWTLETLARIQATDQHFDGIDLSMPNGRLTAGEVSWTLGPGGNQPKVLNFQLLATYFNLATRRIAPATKIKSKTATKLGLANVRAAALYAIATLKLPVAAHKSRYSDISTVLDEIVNNKSEVY